MFKLHDFVMKTLKGMLKHYPEFQVREYALNWYAKGVLTDEDLMEIETWFMPAEEPEQPEEPTEPTDADEVG